jgi:hypothetical protein
MATMDLLQRDFTERRRLCVEHDGSVLKTTGGGAASFGKRLSSEVSLRAEIQPSAEAACRAVRFRRPCPRVAGRERKDRAALRIPLFGAHAFTRVNGLPALGAALPAAKACPAMDGGGK